MHPAIKIVSFSTDYEETKVMTRGMNIHEGLRITHMQRANTTHPLSRRNNAETPFKVKLHRL